MWSGQSPDPLEWYQDRYFWRWGVMPLLFAAAGAGAALTRQVAFPGTSIDLEGTAAVLAGIGMMVVGGLLFGACIAVYKRLHD